MISYASFLIGESLVMAQLYRYLRIRQPRNVCKDTCLAGTCSLRIRARQGYYEYERTVANSRTIRKQEAVWTGSHAYATKNEQQGEGPGGSGDVYGGEPRYLTFTHHETIA